MENTFSQFKYSISKNIKDIEKAKLINNEEMRKKVEGLIYEEVKDNTLKSLINMFENNKDIANETFLKMLKEINKFEEYARLKKYQMLNHCFYSYKLNKEYDHRLIDFFKKLSLNKICQDKDVDLWLAGFYNIPKVELKDFVMFYSLLSELPEFEFKKIIKHTLLNINKAYSKLPNLLFIKNNKNLVFKLNLIIDSIVGEQASWLELENESLAEYMSDIHFFKKDSQEFKEIKKILSKIKEKNITVNYFEKFNLFKKYDIL